MKLSYCGLPTQAINLDTVEAEVTGSSVPVSELIQTVFIRITSIFSLLLFTAASILALPLSFVLVVIALYQVKSSDK